MSGEELYMLFWEAHEESDVVVDVWDDLEEHERRIWNVMADRVNNWGDI
jgi:hypothetical protein